MWQACGPNGSMQFSFSRKIDVASYFLDSLLHSNFCQLLCLSTSLSPFTLREVHSFSFRKRTSVAFSRKIRMAQGGFLFFTTCRVSTNDITSSVLYAGSLLDSNSFAITPSFNHLFYLFREKYVFLSFRKFHAKQKKLDCCKEGFLFFTTCHVPINK